MNVVAIIPSAGEGRRIGRGAKVFLEIQGKPILLWTAQLFQNSPLVKEIIVAAPPGDESKTLTMLQDRGISKAVKVVPGGVVRQESVANALNALPSWVTDDTIIAIHDCARPLLTCELFEKVVESAKEAGAALLAVPVKDTVKVVDKNMLVKSTPSREELWAAQTPQVFKADLIKAAYKRALQDGFIGTDDATLVERLGDPVKIVQGSYENMKITTPEDLLLAARILEARCMK